MHSRIKSDDPTGLQHELLSATMDNSIGEPKRNVVRSKSLFSSGNKTPLWNLSQIFLGIILTLSVVSCRRDQDTSWNVKAAGPIAYGRIGLENLLADSLLSADENGLWHLVISRNLTDFNLDSLVRIPDTVIHRKFVVPFGGGPISIPPGVNVMSYNENSTLQFNSTQLKTVRTSGGMLQYSLKSYVNGYLRCVYSLPGLRIGGEGTVITVNTLPSTGGVPSVASGFIPLNGYELDLTGASGFLRNTIASSLQVNTAPDAPNPSEVFGNDSVVVELRFVEPRVAYARGYFGYHTYNVNETSTFQTGLSATEGVLRVDQAEVRMKLENYTGADAQVTFTQIASQNSGTGNTVSLQQPALFQTINITRATDVGGLVTPVVQERVVNTSNSNINAFVENLPNGVLIQAEVEVNPLGDVSDGNDFIYTNRAINALIEADVPLKFGMNALVFRDTLSFKVPEGLEASGEFFLRIKNRFPFGTSLSGWLLKDDGTMVRQLFADQHVSPALPSGNPQHPLPAESVVRVAFNPADLMVMESGAKLALRVELNTPGFPETVGIYESHFLEVVVVTNLNARVSFR